MSETVKELVPELQTNFFILVGIFLLINGFRFYDALFLKNKLNNSYGVQPRRQFSFVRFFMSTLIHRDRRHLFGNMMPLLILGAISMFPDVQLFWFATIVIILTSGFGTWLFGTANSTHFGASGLVLGYFGFVLTRGLFEGEPVLIFVALFVAGLYRKLFSNIIIRQANVSTTGHLFGFLGGVLAAWLIPLLTNS